MVASTTTLLGLPLPVFGEDEGVWDVTWKNMSQAIEDELTKSFAGDPNGNVAGTFVGQTCADTSGNQLYFCITTGNAASAVWSVLAAGAGGYTTVQEEGSSLTQRATLNFVGGGFTAADNSGKTEITLDAQLNDLAALTPTADNFMVGDGSNFVLETPAQARTSLGLGALALLNTVATAQIDASAVTLAKLADEAKKDYTNQVLRNGTVINETIKVITNSPIAFDILKTRGECSAGSCTGTFQIGGVDLGGTALSVTTTSSEQTHSSANSVAVGADLTLVITSASSCENLAVQYQILPT